MPTRGKKSNKRTEHEKKQLRYQSLQRYRAAVKRKSVYLSASTASVEAGTGALSVLKPGSASEFGFITLEDPNGQIKWAKRLMLRTIQPDAAFQDECVSQNAN